MIKTNPWYSPLFHSFFYDFMRYTVGRTTARSMTLRMVLTMEIPKGKLSNAMCHGTCHAIAHETKDALRNSLRYFSWVDRPMGHTIARSMGHPMCHYRESMPPWRVPLTLSVFYHLIPPRWCVTWSTSTMLYHIPCPITRPIEYPMANSVGQMLHG